MFRAPKIRYVATVYTYAFPSWVPGARFVFGSDENHARERALAIRPVKRVFGTRACIAYDMRRAPSIGLRREIKRDGRWIPAGPLAWIEPDRCYVPSIGERGF